MALDWLKTRFNEIKGEVNSEIVQFRNRTMMEGVVAGCAMIAHADGVVSPEEKQKMAGFMQQSEALNVFKMDDVIKTFTSFAEKFEFDHQIGQAEALRSIAKLKGKNAESRLLVRVCCMIGAADGNFDQNERASTVMICRELGLDPAEFDL
jgi:tellurite resistance protein TerB